MGNEKITPAQKPMPTSGGIKDGGNSVVKTPKQDTGGRYWGGKNDDTGKILK